MSQSFRALGLPYQPALTSYSLQKACWKGRGCSDLRESQWHPKAGCRCAFHPAQCALHTQRSMSTLMSQVCHSFSAGSRVAEGRIHANSARAKWLTVFSLRPWLWHSCYKMKVKVLKDAEFLTRCWVPVGARWGLERRGATDSAVPDSGQEELCHQRCSGCLQGAESSYLIRPTSLCPIQIWPLASVHLDRTGSRPCPQGLSSGPRLRGSSLQAWEARRVFPPWR